MGGADRDVHFAVSLSNLAEAKIEAGDFESALKLDGEALSIRRERLPVRDPLIAHSLRSVARDHFHLGHYDLAARFGEDALSTIVEAIGDGNSGVLPFLNSLSGTYVELGRYDEARSCAERALSIAEASFGHDDTRIVPALQTLDVACRIVGHFREAYDAAERALNIQLTTRGAESFEVGRAMGRLGVILAQIGDTDRARHMFEQALKILQHLRVARNYRINNEIATTIANLAGTYLDLGEPDAARGLYDEALSLRGSVSGVQHPETARLLSNLGLLFSELGEDDRALETWEIGLHMRRRFLGSAHPDIARSLIETATIRLRLGKSQAATDDLLEALAILGCYEMQGVAARAYLLLAGVAEHRALAAAVFFAKLAVNAMQSLRSKVADLGPALDRAFVFARQHAYRLLGDGLIVSGRVPEARQVLTLLKEVELLEMLPGDLDPRLTRASLTPLEAHWSRRGDEIGTRTKSQFNTHTPSVDDAAKYNAKSPQSRLSEALDQAVVELRQWMEELVTDFARIETQPVSEDTNANPAIIDVDAASVPRPIPVGTAFLQYLLAEDQLRIILTSSNLRRHYDLTLAQGEVNRLVFELRSSLQDRSNNFLASARRLHQILIAPVVADIRKLATRTLALSLDGVLRYVPVAALHDGARYLLEDFAIVLAAGREEGEPRSLSELSACGFGVTRAIAPHSALYGVRNELLAVIRTSDSKQGILPGAIRLDQAFTADALRREVTERRSVLHIASHFVFHAAQEASSYLLLGDGTKLTLAELAQMRFDGVELMVLSACDTATGGGHRQTGREVEGLGTLMRRQGARNVIATLWPVADLTTVALMREFYRNWYDGRLPPQEALRNAQLALCSGQIRCDRHQTRGLIDPDTPDAAPSSDHPYYWSPYLLMGSPSTEV
jgi:CHAT domain-containing protein/tetratricopeptide (TPR) repeat protein